MLYDLVEGSEGGDLIYVTGFNAQGARQILPSLSDQRPLLLHYPLTLMIQGARRAVPLRRLISNINRQIGFELPVGAYCKSPQQGLVYSLNIFANVPLLFRSIPSTRLSNPTSLRSRSRRFSATIASRNGVMIRSAMSTRNGWL